MDLAKIAIAIQEHSSPKAAAAKSLTMFKVVHEELKKEFIELIKSCKLPADEEGALLLWLTNSTFFEDPASARYHNAFFGGLLDHSVNVFKLLKHEFESYYSYDNISKRNIIISALLHDVCKIGNYNITSAWRKDSNNKWEAYPGYGYNQDTFPMGHGEKSVAMLSKLITLEDEEMLAIRWHIGAFEDGKKIDFVNAAKNRPLTTMLHMADLQASLLFEAQGTVEWLVNLR